MKSFHLKCLNCTSKLVAVTFMVFLSVSCGSRTNETDLSNAEVSAKKPTPDWSKEELIAIADIRFGDSPSEVVSKAGQSFSGFHSNAEILGANHFEAKIAEEGINIEFRYESEKLYYVIITAGLHGIDVMKEKLVTKYGNPTSATDYPPSFFKFADRGSHIDEWEIGNKRINLTKHFSSNERSSVGFATFIDTKTEKMVSDKKDAAEREKERIKSNETAKDVNKLF